jgi:hypothetical protein
VRVDDPTDRFDRPRRSEQLVIGPARRIVEPKYVEERRTQLLERFDDFGNDPILLGTTDIRSHRKPLISL